MPHRTFEESQKFNQVWLWVLLIAISIWVLVQFPLALLRSSGEEPVSTHSVIMFLISLAFVMGLNAMMYFAKLKTKISDEEISILFRPFINKPKRFKWESIKEAYVRKYKPIWEYGGWGIRYRWSGRAYNTSGNMGLQLIMKSGKKILIGTHKPDELEAFLKKYIFVPKEKF